MAAIFVSESNFEKMSGQDITVAPGGTVESDVLAPFSEPFAYVVCDEEYAMYKAEKIVM